MATSGNKIVRVTNYDTLEFSWSCGNPDIVNNQTVVSWKLELVATGAGLISTSQTRPWSVTVNGSSYSGNVSVAIGNNTRKTLASGSTTIKHNNDGTKVFSYSFSQSFTGITFAGVKLGVVSGSSSGTLPNIPRQSTLSASNGTLGTAQTLTIARNAASYTHTITYKCGTATGTIVTKTTAISVSYTPALALALQNTTGTSVNITFTLQTYNGTTLIGTSTKTIACAIPESVKPSLSITLSDPTGNLTKYGGYLKTKSTVKAVLTATESQGAAIKSYSTTVNGKTYTAQTFTSEILNASGTLEVKATVTDARGRSATVTQTITVLDYATPKISDLKANRCNSDGTNNIKGAYIKVTFSAQINSINSKNTAAYTVKYKKQAETTYTSATVTAQAGKYSVVNGTYVFAADVNSSYDIILVATDALGSTQKEGNCGTESKLFSYFIDKLGWAFGKVAELEGYLDVNLKAMFRKVAEFKDAVTVGGAATFNDRVDFKQDIFDKYNTRIGNGLVSYLSAGIDPDTTTEHCIVTHINTPMGAGIYMYVLTWFYSSKSATSNRMQIAFPYANNGSQYHRYYQNGVWSEWRRHYNAGENHNVLFSTGGYFMNANQYASLNKPVSSQINGIVMEWSRYLNGNAYPSKTYVYVPKSYANGVILDIFLVTGGGEAACSKSVYITDTKITGSANNDKAQYTGAHGIKLTPSQWVLTRVLGV